MWYFTWILGTAFACSFSILNAMWLELDFEYRNKAHEAEEKPEEKPGKKLEARLRRNDISRFHE